MEYADAKRMLILSARVTGFGDAMRVLNRAWKKEMSGAACSVGPCEAEMADCDCDNKRDCDQCCGTGRIPKKALEVKQSLK